MTSKDARTPAKKRAIYSKCPLCGKPEIQKFRPFCSQRCVDLDLGRWLTGEYRIPAEEEVDFDDEFAGDSASEISGEE